MIPFFRKIRKKMADDNKPMKYMRYAIGEIILVVIGILIALSINNWNENQKLKIQEVLVLKELKDDLKQTLRDIRGDSLTLRNAMKSNQIIIQHIEEALPYHDSLHVHFYMLNPFTTFSINQTTYEHLKNTGFSLLSNDSLKRMVSNFYTSDINLYKELEKRVVTEHYEGYTKPMIMTQFKSYKMLSVQPRNYQEFIHNADNLQIMNFTLFICNGLTNYQGYLLQTIEKLIAEIDEEIKNK